MNLTKNRSRAIAVAVLAATVSLFFGTVAEAQNPNYVLSINDILIPPGGSSVATLSLDSSAGAAIGGLSFGVCSDPAVVLASSADLATDLLTINNGTVPDFLVVEFFPGGITAGMVVNFIGMADIPPAANTDIIDVIYDAVGAVGSTTGLNLCETLGSPTVTVVLVVGGAPVTPVSVSGTAEIEIPAPFALAFSTPFLAVPNQSVEAFVELSNTGPVEGFSFGLTSDAAQLSLASATATGALAATNGGTGPDFLQVNILTGGTATVQCTVSTGGAPDSIAAGSDQAILSLDYDVDAAAGPPCALTAIAFSDALGVAISATSLGVVEPVGTGDGEVEIGNSIVAPPSGGITLSAEVVGVIPGDPASSRVLLDTDTAIEAISFGITYDDTDMSLDTIDMGSSLANLRCGAGPEFYFADTTTVGGVGMILGAVFAVSPPLAGRSLNPGAGHEIAVLNFSTSASPIGTGSDLEFTGTLGTFPISVEVTIDGMAFAPSTSNGEVVLGHGTGNFLRGNCNGDPQVDLGDAIFVLNFLFPAGTPPTTDCEDACDGNDDGSLNVADAVAILGFLFQSTGPLPNPNSCGIDPTVDTFTCASVTNCP